MVLAALTPQEVVDALLPSMFSDSTPAEVVEDFGASMLTFHPAGFRAMARASADNLHDVLPHIRVPTLLVYGDSDVRAPLHGAEDLRATISGSRLVVLPGAGHLGNIEAPASFNSTVHDFLRSTPA